MSLNYNEIDARIQLKRDIQVNWDTSAYVALDGELIIYEPDYNQQNNPNGYTYARLKIGDGTTQIKNLPFIDSGTVNGKIIEEVIQMYNNYGSFPRYGDTHNHSADQKSLYVDKATGKIFYWDDTQSDYVQIGGVSYSATTANVQSVSSWSTGDVTSLVMQGHKLVITTGTSPALSTNSQTVVTGLVTQ